MGNQSIHGPQRQNSISLRPPIKIITLFEKIKKRGIFWAYLQKTANVNPTLKLNDKRHRTANPFNSKHAQTQTKSRIARTGLKIIQTCSRVGQPKSKRRVQNFWKFGNSCSCNTHRSIEVKWSSKSIEVKLVDQSKSNLSR